MSDSGEGISKYINKICDQIRESPEMLYLPHFLPLKNLIEHFGGNVPLKKVPEAQSEKMEDLPPLDESEDESEMSDIPGIDEGVIEGDEIVDQPMGDSSKTPTEEEMDQATEYRSKAASAYGEQNYQEAIDLYTKAIELNPGNALFHAKRGQAYLKLQKPNACIRDCDKALEINCDSAAAYKFRGRAHRLLGKWEDAAKDLRQACKIDFDEETDDWLREVNPIAKKMEMHRVAKERKEAEKVRKSREKAAAAARKAREEAAKKQQEDQKNDAGSGGFPPGSESLFDMLYGSGVDPEIMEALNDIRINPQNIGKYASNPKILKVLENLTKGFTGGRGGAFPGAGGAFPGAGGAFPGAGGAFPGAGGAFPGAGGAFPGAGAGAGFPGAGASFPGAGAAFPGAGAAFAGATGANFFTGAGAGAGTGTGAAGTGAAGTGAGATTENTAPPSSAGPKAEPNKAADYSDGLD